MEIIALKKTEVNCQDLAELACVAKKDHSPAQGASEGNMLQEVAQGIANDCHDFIFAAYDHGQLVGWLAFYELSGSSIAQIWDWHPIVRPGEREDNVAIALTQKALAYLTGIGLRQVSIDFRVDHQTEARFVKYLDWYAAAWAH